MFPTNGCSEKYKKKDRSPRLFEKMTDQTHPIYASAIAIFHAPHFKVHFSVAGSKSF